MSSEWRRRPIRDLCTDIIDCVNKTAPVVEGPTPFRMIRTTNVKNGRVDLGAVRYVEQAVYERWVRRGEPEDDDIILTREAPLGEVGMLKDAAGVFLGQRLVMYRVDPEEADADFLMNAMRGPEIQAQIRALGSGSTVEHMRVPDCGELIVSCPPTVDDQRRIGAILASFDELIRVNERRIEVLENLARGLYSEWFVRFRFPGNDQTSLVDSAIGPVPPDWSLRPASTVLSVNPRTRSTQAQFGKIAMSDVDTRYSPMFPSEVVTRPSGARFQQHDVLLARITPCLQNGKTGLVQHLTDHETGVGSTEFIVLRGATVGPAFTYCAARSERVRRHAITSMTGATGRQRVANGCFDSLLIAEPPSHVAANFEEATMPLLNRAFEAAVQNRRLAAARDLLLPRLVTGRLDISGVDLDALLDKATA